MTEVYAVGEEEDGTLRPLCKGLFQSNLDTNIRESFIFADAGRWMLILVNAKYHAQTRAMLV